MAAADDQPHAGENVLTRGQLAGVDMGLQMVDRHQRDAQGRRERFGRHHADQQRPGQPRRVGHGHGVQLLGLDPGGGRAPSITGRIRSRCAREASSGTTPP